MAVRAATNELTMKTNFTHKRTHFLGTKSLEPVILNLPMI